MVRYKLRISVISTDLICNVFLIKKHLVQRNVAFLSRGDRNSDVIINNAVIKPSSHLLSLTTTMFLIVYVSAKFDQFWSVNRKLMENSESDPFRHIPFRIHWVRSGAEWCRL